MEDDEVKIVYRTESDEERTTHATTHRRKRRRSQSFGITDAEVQDAIAVDDWEGTRAAAIRDAAQVPEPKRRPRWRHVASTEPDVSSAIKQTTLLKWTPRVDKTVYMTELNDDASGKVYSDYTYVHDSLPFDLKRGPSTVYTLADNDNDSISVPILSVPRHCDNAGAHANDMEQRHKAACSVCVAPVHETNSDNDYTESIGIVREASCAVFIHEDIAQFDLLLAMTIPLCDMRKISDSYAGTVSFVGSAPMEYQNTPPKFLLHFDILFDQIFPHLSWQDMVALGGTCRTLRCYLCNHGLWRDAETNVLAFKMLIHEDTDLRRNAHLTTPAQTSGRRDGFFPYRMPLEVSHLLDTNSSMGDKHGKKLQYMEELRNVCIFNSLTRNDQEHAQYYTSVNKNSELLRQSPMATILKKTIWGEGLHNCVAITSTMLMQHFGVRTAMRLWHSTASPTYMKSVKKLSIGRTQLGLCTAGLRVHALLLIADTCRYAESLIASHVPLTCAAVCRTENFTVCAYIYYCGMKTTQQQWLIDSDYCNMRKLLGHLESIGTTLHPSTNHYGRFIAPHFFPSKLANMYRMNRILAGANGIPRKWLWMPAHNSANFLRILEADRTLDPALLLVYAFHPADTSMHNVGFATLPGYVSKQTFQHVLRNGVVLGPLQSR